MKAVKLIQYYCKHCNVHAVLSSQPVKFFQYKTKVKTVQCRFIFFYSYSLLIRF